jgi:glutathione synthase/RimK-type ligase-like ATP-grasp enzyme
MWRFGYSATVRLFAKRLLVAIEHGLGIPVFPSSETVWHFEDKVAQHYLLLSAGIRTPTTWMFWKRFSSTRNR